MSELCGKLQSTGMGLDPHFNREVKGWKAETQECGKALRVWVETPGGTVDIIIRRDRSGIEKLATIRGVDMTGLAERIKEWYFGKGEEDE